MALLALSLSACVTEPGPEVLSYDCALTTQCGPAVDVSHVEFCGTYEDVKEMAHEWTASCQALIEHRVRNRECPYIVCGAFCPAADATPSACDL